MVGGRACGPASGSAPANAVQGSAAALGVGAIIAASQPVFEAIRWAGVAYLCWLGGQALRSAWRGSGPQAGTPPRSADGPSDGVRLRQGFLSNVTNPKVLVFYLSVLPQFLAPGAPLGDALTLAYTHAVLGLAWLALLVTALHGLRGWLACRRVRRSLDALTGLALLGFAGKLATDAR